MKSADSRTTSSRDRRREQQRLAIARQHLQDAAQRRQEAHVEHAIGLVEAQDLDARQVDGALLHVIEQASGGGDNDVGAPEQLFLLRHDRDAAENRGDAQVRRHTVGGQRLVHLQRKLAGRHQDQAARLARPGRGTAADEQPIDHRQAERGGLAGAGLRLGEQVAAGQNDRNGLQLHRRGRGVAQAGKRIGKRGRKAQRSERHVQTTPSKLPGAFPHTTGRRFLTNITRDKRRVWI